MVYQACRLSLVHVPSLVVLIEMVSGKIGKTQYMSQSHDVVYISKIEQDCIPKAKDPDGTWTRKPLTNKKLFIWDICQSCF